MPSACGLSARLLVLASLYGMVSLLARCWGHPSRRPRLRYDTIRYLPLQNSSPTLWLHQGFPLLPGLGSFQRICTPCFPHHPSAIGWAGVLAGLLACWLAGASSRPWSRATLAANSSKLLPRAVSSASWPLMVPFSVIENAASGQAAAPTATGAAGAVGRWVAASAIWLYSLSAACRVASSSSGSVVTVGIGRSFGAAGWPQAVRWAAAAASWGP